jgi:hypothetical protein
MDAPPTGLTMKLKWPKIGPSPIIPFSEQIRKIKKPLYDQEVVEIPRRLIIGENNDAL